MAFNKSKALESALKYLNQGKVAQAIGEYQQILRHDPKDQATLMTVGDLYARQGEMHNATEYFERLAQVYLGDGFNSKAIAIYKKIAKLAPNELAPLERLADLYVQQGVLSEARPLFLQIAEAYLKANRAPKAVEALHRLLDVEPDNPRVQMRLAELYNVMGQKKEAAQTYLNYGQRLFDRGETDEAEKLAERAIAVDASSMDALLLRGKALVALHRDSEAIGALEKHPDADVGGDVTTLLVGLELKAGHTEKAADRARNQLLRGSSHSGLLLHVVDTLVAEGKAAQALPLLGELKDAMVAAGEPDKYLKALSDTSQRLQGNPEPLEMMADFCRHTSDPFRLSSALSQLVDIYAATGDYSRAEAAMLELIDRNKDDERLVQKLTQLRARSGGTADAAEQHPASVSVAPSAAASAAATLISDSPEPPRAASQPLQADTFDEPPPQAAAEEPIDAETQKYIAQALTDVDLFSSYGLTQKATNLLETVLERAPRHTPTLERLLDFYLGAGNERRTAELASQLEQIYSQRGDTQNSERFSELRMRFQAAAGMSAADLPSAPPIPEAASAATAEVAHAASGSVGVPAEFEIALVPIEDEETSPAQQVSAVPVPPASSVNAKPSNVPGPVAPSAQAAITEEVDLSDEWESIANEAAETSGEAVHEGAAEEPADEPIIELVGDESANQPEEQPEFSVAAVEELDPIIGPDHAIEGEHATQEMTGHSDDQHASDGAAPADFELELVADEAKKGKAAEKTTDDFISELAAEFEDLQADAPAVQAVGKASIREEVAAPIPTPMGASSATPQAKPVTSAPPASKKTTLPAEKVRADYVPPATTEKAPQATVQSLNQLSEVFQEFRSELGELDGDEDEDLETHYNLGIAYREMGLLDEAIGEFQKVAKAVQKGKPFAYAMNCSTLLALSFSDKGEPKIAALWYRRALEMPGLDQEAVLALRYDLGVSLEMAGDASAALDSFRQVYAMNIDYRDVADRIATLQKR